MMTMVIFETKETQTRKRGKQVNRKAENERKGTVLRHA